MSEPARNQLTLLAAIAEISPLRRTPAGLPALGLQLEHESQQEEAGQMRAVKASVKAVALGSMAERLQHQALGTHGHFLGFLMSPRGGKQLVFHIQQFQTV